MAVQFAERKDTSSIRPGRTSFSETIKTSTVLFITLPLTPSTANLLSTAEFSLMRPDALIINVARGGIVDEDALVEALKEKKIQGAATDVFVEEPAGKENSVLMRAAKEWSESGEEGIRGLNGRLVLSPHVAWWARASIEKLRGTVSANVEGWARGEVVNQVL
jgi:lactate dehydrogenase-like 2-hydroxyacid dehydrogenase